MDIFNPNFVLYFLFLFCLTTFTFFTGGFISRILYVSKTVHLRIFINLLIGFVFWIILTAFYFTKGNSIFLIFPVGFLFWKIIFKQSFTRHKYTIKTILSDSKDLFKEMWFLLFIFILFAIKHIYANGYIESDYLFFGNVSYSMKQSGMEGINFGMFTSYIVHPYHYADMWLTAFITEIFKTNYYLTNVFLSIPFLLFIVYSGTIALVKEIGMRFFDGANLSYTFLYSSFIIVIGGLDYIFIREYMKGTIALIQIPKTSIIYAIYILALIFLLRNKIKHAFFVSLMLTPLYTQAVFFVLPAIGILVCISLFNNYKIGLKYLMYYLAIVLTFFLFYFINSKFSNEASIVSFDESKIFEGLSTFPIQFVKKSIRFIIIYLPFLILFIISIRPDKLRPLINNLKSSRLFLIIITFLLSGYLFSLVFSSALFAVNQDYAQVLYNGFLPLMAILSLTAIIFAVYDLYERKKNNFLIKIILFFVVGTGLILQHHRDPRYWGQLTKIEVDEKFYQKLAENLKDDDKIGTFQNFESPVEVHWFQYNYQLYPNLRRIANFRNNGVYFPECLNVNEMDTTRSEHRKYYYKKSPFVHFLDSLKKEDKKITSEEGQYLFIKKYEFDYIIIPENIKTPDHVKSVITDSIMRNDGLRVYRLYTNKADNGNS